MDKIMAELLMVLPYFLLLNQHVYEVYNSDNH